MVAAGKMAIDFNIHENQRDDDDVEDGEEAQREEESKKQDELRRSFRIVTISLAILAVPHVIAGSLCVVLGIILCSRAPIWLAHTISPIWSGVTILLCGLVGLMAAKRKTVYTILCFTAASMVSLIIGIVSLQLLRLGLVDHTTSGQTFIKDETDTYVVVALCSMSVACLFAVITFTISGFLARHMKRKAKYLKRRVQTKEQMIAERQEQLRKQKDQEKKILEKMEKEQARSTRYHRI